MRKIFYILISILSLNVFANDIEKARIMSIYEDMNANPFLAGEWKTTEILNIKGNAYYIELLIESNHKYSMNYFENNTVVNNEFGMILYDDKNVTLFTKEGGRTIYNYEFDNESFKLGDIPFKKSKIIKERK